MNKEKGAKILYESLELKYYLSSWSHLKLEDPRFTFSLKTETNPLKWNFRKILRKKWKTTALKYVERNLIMNN